MQVPVDQMPRKSAGVCAQYHWLRSGHGHRWLVRHGGILVPGSAEVLPVSGSSSADVFEPKAGFGGAGHHTGFW